MANGRRTGKACHSEKQAKSPGCDAKSKSDGKVKKQKAEKKPAVKLAAAVGAKKTSMASGRRPRRSPAEMYKSRHNIGNRSAAERVRVGSYRESEIALYFPDTYWPAAVKVDFHNSPARAHDQTDEDDDDNSKATERQSSETTSKAKSRSTSREKKKASNSVPKDGERDSSPSKKQEPVSIKMESCDWEDDDSDSDSAVKPDPSLSKKATAATKKDSKAPSSKFNIKTPSRTPSPKKEHKGMTSSNDSKALTAASKDTKTLMIKSVVDGKKPGKALKQNKNPAVKSGKLPAASNKSTEHSKNNPNFSKPSKVSATKTQSSRQNKADGAKTVAAKPKVMKGDGQQCKVGSSKTNQKEKRLVAKYAHLKPRAPRIKRTACLNAGAITSLMLECDEPVSKRRKSETAKDEADEDYSIIKAEPKSRSPSKDKKHNKDAKPKQKSKRDNEEEFQASKKKKKTQEEVVRKGKTPGKNKDVKGKGKAAVKVKVEKSPKRKVELPEISLWPPPKRMASLNAQAILAACREDWPSVKRQRLSAEMKQKREKSTEDSPVKKPESPQKKSDKKSESATATEPEKQTMDKSLKSPVKSSSPATEAKDQTKSPQNEQRRSTGTPSVAGSSPDIEITKVTAGTKGATTNSAHNQQGHSPPGSSVTRKEQQPVSSTATSVQCPLPTPPPSMSSMPYSPPSKPGGPNMQQLQRPFLGTQPPPPSMQQYPQPNFHPRFASQYMQPPQYPMQHPEVQPVPSYPPQSNTPQKPHFKPGYEPHCPTPMGGTGSGFQHVAKVEKTQPNAPWDMNNPSPVKRQHNTVHKSAPMGNTCTYPYPHSNSHNTSSQAYPMAGGMTMESTGSYSMVPYPKHYGNTFYNQQQQVPYGYYQPAGPLLQTMSGDPCCMPPAMSMQVPQPQVKVLVHNTGVPSSGNNALPVDMSRAGMRYSSAPFSMPNRGVDMSMNARTTPVSMTSSLPPPPLGTPMSMHHPGMPLQGMHNMNMMQAHMNMAQPPLDYSRGGYSMGGRPPMPPHPLQRPPGPVGMTTASTQLSAPMPDMSQMRHGNPHFMQPPVNQHPGHFRGNRMQLPRVPAQHQQHQQQHPCNPKSENIDSRSDGEDDDDEDDARKSDQNNDSDYVILNLDSIKQDKSPGGRDSVQSALPLSEALLADMPRQCAPGPKLERLSPASAPELSRPTSDMWCGNPRSSKGPKQEGKRQEKADKTKKPAKSETKSPRKDPKASTSKQASTSQRQTEQKSATAISAIKDKESHITTAKSTGISPTVSQLHEPKKQQQVAKGRQDKTPQASSLKSDEACSKDKTAPVSQQKSPKTDTQVSKSKQDNSKLRPDAPKAKPECSKQKTDNPKGGKKDETQKATKDEFVSAKLPKDDTPSGAKKRSQGEPACRPSSLGSKSSPRGKLSLGEIPGSKLSPGAKIPPGINVSTASKGASKISPGPKTPTGGKGSPRLKVPNGGKVSPGLKSPSGSKGSPRLKVPNGGRVSQGLNIQTGGKVSPGLRITTGGKLSPGLRVPSWGKLSPGGKQTASRQVSQGGKVSPTLKKREVVKVLNCQWHWEGGTHSKAVYVQVDTPSMERACYASIKHDDGDIIRERDCVLVKSGPRKKDIPYVAKIAALWETDTGEMMMSVLWYYRPEHTETERLPHYIGCEVFASKHCDQIPVACIDDKCHVLTFNEYCRYKTEQKRLESGHLPRPPIIPRGDLPENRRLLPALEANPETVFLCRKVYDLKRKRVLKNPHPNMPASPMPPKTPPSASAALSVTPAASAATTVVVAAAPVTLKSPASV